MVEMQSRRKKVSYNSTDSDLSYNRMNTKQWHKNLKKESEIILDLYSKVRIWPNALFPLQLL